ncbi:MAG: phosphatase PAP2 family protein [bacterium]|nr:phosphatase PAP2 family protein [bacterium]
MLIVFALSLVCVLLILPAVGRRETGSKPLFVRTGGQWKKNYGRRSFVRLGVALAGAAVLAFSGADEVIEGWHRDSVRSNKSDSLSHFLKFGGERFWFGNWAMVAALDGWVRSNAFSRWGRANFEAMAVGLPLLWTVQRGLGANRPSSDDGSPKWKPMKAANSASGHAFIGAVPWLTLARRHNLVPVKKMAQLGSVLTGWSRLNDRKHYLSQIVLGWTIAYNAVAAVADDEIEKSEIKEISAED